MTVAPIASEKRNQYFVVSPDSQCISWNPQDPHDRPTYDSVYFGGVLSEFERLAPGRGLTVYLTADVEELPSYGPDVVAVVISDEWARVPAYTDRIHVTFKCYGTDLLAGPGFFSNPSLLGLATSVQFVRVMARRLPTVWRREYGRWRSRSGVRPVYPIPLGYLRQASLPLQPILERPYDVYFRGSMSQSTSRSFPRQLLQSPKTLSRTEMVHTLKDIARRYPDLAIMAEQFPTFFTGDDDEALTFSQTMMQTKVCVVPRGASFETFRYFEALRYGCVVIAEPLPNRWFYDGSPAITIDRWSQLESVLVPLLRDEALLKRTHSASLAWWRNVCNEAAVGRYMAELS